MIVDIMDILHNDSILDGLLCVTPTDGKIKPGVISGEGIAYTYYDILSSDTARQAQFKITICNSNLLVAQNIKRRIDKLLVTVGDTPLSQNILSCGQSGGGMYYDNDSKIYKIVSIYILKGRV